MRINNSVKTGQSLHPLAIMSVNTLIRILATNYQTYSVSQLSSEAITYIAKGLIAVSQSLILTLNAPERALEYS